MTQPDLFAYRPLARNNDPRSSHTAARANRRSGRNARQCRMTLQIVQRWPGRTSKELATVGDRDRYLLARRLADLRDRMDPPQVTNIDPETGIDTGADDYKGQLRWWPV